MLKPFPPSSLPTPIRNIESFSLSGKLIFIRLDLNVPLRKTQQTQTMDIAEDHRIIEALPTLRYAKEQGGKLVLASHLGRPRGQRQPQLSLDPVARRLADLLNQEVTLVDNCIGDGVSLLAQGLKKGEILLLENLRFHPGEEENRAEFVKNLAKLGQIYINDAFGTAHRKHASTYGLPAHFVEKGMGYLIAKELHYLDLLIQAPQKPFYVLLGGAKVTDKLKVIQSLFNKMDGLMIGGAVSHAFWVAKGRTLPDQTPPPPPDSIHAAQLILAGAQKRNIPIILPEDLGPKGLDIGPQTCKQYPAHLAKAQTVFWNGPMGYFENPQSALGTTAIAQALAQQTSIRIVGGGETVSALKQAKLEAHFTYLSTGGGATLAYLENQNLPGLEALKTHSQDQTLC